MRTDSAARITIPWQTTSAGSGPFSTSSSAAPTRCSCATKDSPPGKAKSGSALAKAANSSGASAITSSNERFVQSPASVSMKRASSLRLQPDLRGDRVGRFARAQQRAAPQRGEAVRDSALAQLGRLLAPQLVERDRLLALEAPLVVVSRASVARQVDAGGGGARQDRSKRSRFMTLSQAATKSRTNFSPASSEA